MVKQKKGFKFWIKHIFTGAFIIGLLFVVLKSVKFGFDRIADGGLDFLNGKSGTYVKKEKADIEKKKQNIRNKDQERKSVRDKHSKIVSMILLVFLIPAILQAEYIVWDNEDGIYRDYETKENYIVSLEEEKELFLNESKTNKMIIFDQDRLIEYLEKENKRKTISLIGQKIEKWALVGVSLYLMYLLFDK